MEPRERLERLIMGLEQSIPEMRARLQYIPPEDIERRYTEKFVASMEEELAKARRDLKAMDAAGPDG